MKSENWTEFYTDMVERNIGMVSYEQQEKIRNSHVAIFGVGGMGSRIAEILVRAGCENITIVDSDSYTISNLSTQSITQEDIGKQKVDVLADTFHKINPSIKIHKYYEVSEGNIREILTTVSFATLSLDGPLGSIIVTRECRKQKIPIVESWSMPFLFAWWFTHENPSYENCYNLTTRFKSIQELQADSQLPSHVREQVFEFFERFPQFHEFYDREPGKFSQMKKGEISLRSFAPFVLMTAAFLAYEIIFTAILKIIPMTLAPNIKIFDLFNFKTQKLN